MNGSTSQILTTVGDGVPLGDVITIGGNPHTVTNVRRVAGGRKVLEFADGNVYVLGPTLPIQVMRTSRTRVRLVAGRDGLARLALSWEVFRVAAAPSTLTRPLRPSRNESCGDCGGSGADSSGKSCGTRNGLGEIYCRVDHQAARVPLRFSIRKEHH
ncbi:hypothetical protein ACFV0R_21595 [Streptomyces sp. NPDC059578]|uniref:hypothetical protein n=1 Tax=unclassified Streptomyces TaxID=2593676 RepID=UPI003658AC89